MFFSKKVALSLLFCFFFSVSFAQLKVIEYKLENGLTVILNPDKNLNDISGAVAVNTGSKNDPADATGISHYLEHLLFKGTDELGTSDYKAEKVHLDSINYYYDQLGNTTDESKRKTIQGIINKHSVEASKYAMPNEFDKLLQSIGSSKINATTNKDLTIYFNTFPSHQAPKWLNLYAHRFSNPVFRSFQSELEVVYEEKNRSLDDLQRRIFDVINKNFYEAHAYEKHTLGKIEHLKNPSLTKMYDYYKQYYVPENMALILSGNFDAETLKPIILETFGKWESKKLVKAEITPPKAFEGRKVIKTRISPIKVGMYGFRTVPSFHEDEAALRVASYILQNEAETGLIDELVTDNKLMMAFSFSDNIDEAGSQFFILIPKIFGQSFSKIESLMHEQLNKLKNGDFSDKLLATVKNELYKNNQLRIENKNGRGYLFAEGFRTGLSWEEVRNHLNKVETITREDIQRVAKKYFQNDYLVIQSRTGFPKKNKLKKPDFKPLKIKQDKESVYAKKFEKLKELSPTERYIDFEKDLSILPLGKTSKLFTVNNPANNIYELEIKFHQGELSDKKIDPTSFVMNYAHPKGTKLNEFKEKLGQLGTTMNISSSGNYFTIELVGLEKNVADVLKEVNQMIENPTINDNSIKTVNNSVKTDRKAEQENATLIARSIAQYGLYGEKSLYRNRMTAKEIKGLEASDYLATFDVVKDKAVSIHYSGKLAPEKLQKIIQSTLTLNYNGKSLVPYPYDIVDRTENGVYLIDNKKLVQSHSFFVKKSSQYQLNNYAKMNLFNQYYDGGFSGILTQEVREYRSLAYSSGGSYGYGFSTKPSGFFYTYLGCQADKTNRATNLVYQLIQELPEKPERMETVRKNVTLSLQSSFPSFRDLSKSVEKLMIDGYTNDPNKSFQKEFASLSFKDLMTFYNENIKPAPVFLGIHGDTKQFDLNELGKIGKIKKLKVSDVIKF